LLGDVSLRQRKWDHADGQKQKHVKGTSNKMSFNGGIDLLFHIGLGFFLFKSWFSCFPKKIHFGRNVLFTQERRRMSILFFNIFFTRIQGVVAGIGDPGRRHRRRLQI
jgi:hypothetical protein